MDYTKFVNRNEELAFLKKVLASDQFELVPVWGRRRVGKTALLLNSIGHKGIYFLASEVTDHDNIRRFQEVVSEFLSDPKILDIKPDWEAVFRSIADKNLTIIIDEFPYLISSNSAIPSIFQRIVDLHLSKTKTKLLLCGSSIRMMESSLLDYKAPLYGRRTGQIHLAPLMFEHLKEFFPRYNISDLVRVYGICGGIPPYLKAFNPSHSFWSNVEHSVLDPNATLINEVDFLLRQELTNLTIYRSLLKEISMGRNKMEEIRDSLGMGRSDVSPYLNKLISLGLIERIVPVTERDRGSRKGLYRINDPLVDFHFRFIHPYRTMLESGSVKGVLERIKLDYDSYMGRIFERVALAAFLKWSNTEGLNWEAVGPWWYKGDEIDLVALASADRTMLCGEFKWSKRIIDIGPVDALIEKAKKVPWKQGQREERFLFVSMGGFTPRCLNYMQEKGIHGWDGRELERIFWGRPKHR